MFALPLSPTADAGEELPLLGTLRALPAPLLAAGAGAPAAYADDEAHSRPRVASALAPLCCDAPTEEADVLVPAAAFDANALLECASSAADTACVPASASGAGFGCFSRALL